MFLPVQRDRQSVLAPGSGGSLNGDEFPGRWVGNCLLEQTPLEYGILIADQAQGFAVSVTCLAAANGRTGRRIERLS